MSAHKVDQNIYIVDGVRTPIGSSHKSLKEFSAAHLASFLLAELHSRYPALCDHAEQVFLGNTVSAGTGQNIARQAIIDAGLNPSIPGTVLNSVCGSGLEAVIAGCRALLCQEMSLVLAGGTESASQSPQLLFAHKKDPVESLICDGLWCAMSDKHMGQLAEEFAQKFGVSALSQNQFAYESHIKAIAAQDAEKFKNEIVVIKTISGDIVNKDDRPRRNVNLEKIQKLPPAFHENGTITAGNAPAPADGAALILLASAEALAKHPYFKPKAKIISYASVALAPEKCFEAGVVAVRECLSSVGLASENIDVFEIGESFAAQAVWTKEQLKIPAEKINLYGGDIALGHPLGATSARILVTLMHALENENRKHGLAVMCFGSGGATSMIIERL